MTVLLENERVGGGEIIGSPRIGDGIAFNIAIYPRKIKAQSFAETSRGFSSKRKRLKMIKFPCHPV
jgi:hypothetical protein